MASAKKSEAKNGTPFERLKSLGEEISELEKQIEEKRTEGRELRKEILAELDKFSPEASPARGKRAVGQRVCSVCGEAGHNSRFHKKEKAAAAGKA